MTRMASMKKDQGDWNQFRHHRSRNMGHCVSWEYYQPVPYLFTREGAQISLTGHYRGRSAFMICNGPSLVSGNYDLTLLKKPGVITYGINNGPKTLRPNFWTCVDDPKRFLKSIWLDPNICKIVPHAHAEKPLFDSEAWKDLEMPHPLTGEVKRVLVGDCPNVLYFHRNSKFMADRFLYEDTINWGNAADYGGGRSVMLPTLRMLFILGFRKVFLLGADFKMSETYTYHFDEQRNKGAVKGNLATYDRMKNEYFPALKPIFDEEGFEVYNCARPEDSDLKVFPFVKYEDAIKFCTDPLGDLVNERTWGLYSKPDERQKWKEEPKENQKAHISTIANRPEAPVNEADVTKVAKVIDQRPKIQQVEQRPQRMIPAPPQIRRQIPQAPDVEQEIPRTVVRPTPLVQLYPDGERIIKNKPCGPIESIGSSRRNAEPVPDQQLSRDFFQEHITLPDDGK